MSTSNDGIAVVGNNTALRSVYASAQSEYAKAAKAAKAAEEAAKAAGKAADIAIGKAAKAAKGPKAAAEEAAKAAESAKVASKESREIAKAAAEDADKAEEAAQVAYKAVLESEAAAKAAKDAEEAAAKATEEAAAKAAKAAEEAAANAPMVLSNQESQALDILKTDSELFRALSEKAVSLDAESLVVLARVKAGVLAAYQNYKRVQLWDVSAIAKIQESFPYILTAKDAEEALEKFCADKLYRSPSWLASRLRIVKYPVLLDNLTGPTMGIASEFASRFVVITESMWRMAVSEDGSVKIGTTKIANHAALWAEYSKAAKLHYSNLATEAGANTSTAFRKPALDAQADKFAKWESGLLDGSYVVTNGVVESKADKDEEAAAKAAKIAEEAAAKAKRDKAAKAAAAQAATIKAAAEEAAKAAAKAATIKAAAEEAAAKAEEAAAKAAAAEDGDKAAAEEAAKAAAKVAQVAQTIAEEAAAESDKAAKAAEEAESSSAPIVRVSTLIAEHDAIEVYQDERIAEYQRFSDDELTAVLLQVFEQMGHARKLDIVAYACTAVYIDNAGNRQ